MWTLRDRTQTNINRLSMKLLIRGSFEDIVSKNESIQLRKTISPITVDGETSVVAISYEFEGRRELARQVEISQALALVKEIEHVPKSFLLPQFDVLEKDHSEW